MWEPAGTELSDIGAQLRDLGARKWQIQLTAPMLQDAVVSAQSAD
jgi:hypothetical protein